MAYICEKPKGSCPECGHFRYDPDEASMCCFAQVDLKNAAKEKEEEGVEKNG